MKKLKKKDIAEFFSLITEKGTAPVGLIPAYIRETVNTGFFDIFYSSSKQEVYDSVVYTYRIKETLCVEEWRQGEKFTELFEELTSKEEKVNLNISDKNFGLKHNCELIDTAIEMNKKLNSSKKKINCLYKQGSAEHC
jgi:hypothetical protein